MNASAPGRLREVVGHWMPRIQVAGIAATDAERLIAETGSWENWCATWSAEGERHVAEGVQAETAGRLLTAGEAYRRAALFFHFAQFMFFDDLAQKDAAARRRVETYRRAAPLLDPPAEVLAVDTPAGVLHGYLRRPGKGACALVIIVPGSDSTKEEFAGLESHFLRRGLATFSFDGPGQGEGRVLGPLSPDWGEVLRAIAARLRTETGLDGRLGIMGMAFGGHLVLQGAHAVPDLEGVVCMNGFYDLGAFWRRLPEVYRANMRYTLGGATPDETAARARRFSLAETPAPRAPVLIIHGARDRIFPLDDARYLPEYLGAGAHMVEYAEGNHVCNNIAYRYRPLMADWLAERLGGRTSAANVSGA